MLGEESRCHSSEGYNFNSNTNPKVKSLHWCVALVQWFYEISLVWAIQVKVICWTPKFCYQLQLILKSHSSALLLGCHDSFRFLDSSFPFAGFLFSWLSFFILSLSGFQLEWTSLLGIKQLSNSEKNKLVSTVPKPFFDLMDTSGSAIYVQSHIKEPSAVLAAVTNEYFKTSVSRIKSPVAYKKCCGPKASSGPTYFLKALDRPQEWSWWEPWYP